MDSIAILDFGSQYSQLIARRVREAHVYSELLPYDTPAEQVLGLAPRGFILSGGPASIYEPGAPQIPGYVFETGLPILGICYGMQALTHALGGVVSPSAQREYGWAQIEVGANAGLIQPGEHAVWMSHGDRIETAPAGFRTIARSKNSPIAASTFRWCTEMRSTTSFWMSSGRTAKIWSRPTGMEMCASSIP